MPDPTNPPPDPGASPDDAPVKPGVPASSAVATSAPAAGAGSASSAGAGSAPSAGAAPAHAAQSGWQSPSLPLAALVVAVLAAGASALLWQRSDSLGREAARRLQAGDVRIAQLEAQLQQSQEQTRDLASRSAVLESKLAEAIGQQAQLERMYRDIAQDGITVVLADVENSLSIASQQLVVSGNVRGAMSALQDADARLKRIKQPEALGLRRLIARDIERLNSVPNVDVATLALRLDAVAAGLGQLPMVAGLTPAGTTSASRETQGAPSGFSLERIASTGREGWRALVAELSQLFRVNRVDAPDAVLLAPEQQYFVRENLRLTLQSARIALLARIEPAWHADLDRAIGWLETYYERQSRPVGAAVATLRQLQSTRIAADLPSLGETLAAVRAARAARDGNP